MQTFQRNEKKYLLDQPQYEQILKDLKPYMEEDRFYQSKICSIYYDTDSYELIRRSIEKPDYKEKLRIRSYCTVGAESPVFVELKKKYNGVVYKRRLCLPNRDAMAWLSGQKSSGSDTQIANEIDYFMQLYGILQPTLFLSYEREAYYCKDGTDFRVTFDDTILCRQENLSLEADVYGAQLLPDGMTLMEIKCSGGIPPWMVQMLSKEKIYKTSFSKYGTAYKTLIFPQIHPINLNRRCKNV